MAVCDPVCLQFPHPLQTSDEVIEWHIAERRQAKADKDYPKADEIRRYLQEQGVELADKAGGVTTWWRMGSVGTGDVMMVDVISMRMADV